MASPEELTPFVPETLPEDFGEWDGDKSSAPPADGSSSQWDAVKGVSETPKTRAKAEYFDSVRSFEETPRVRRPDPPAPVAPKQVNDFGRPKQASTAPLPRESDKRTAVNRPIEPPKPVGRSAGPAVNRADQWPAVSEPAFSKPQKSTDGLPSNVSRRPDTNESSAAASRPRAAAANGARTSRELATAEMRKADEALFEIFSTETPKADEKVRPSIDKRIVFGGVGALAVVILLVLIISLRHHGTDAAEAKQSVTQVPVAAETAPVLSDSKPSAGAPLTPGKPQATAAPQTADSQAAAEQSSANSTPAVSETQAKMMNDQLAAPRTISRNTSQVAENGPPPASFGVEGLGGGGGMGSSVFNSHGQPVVKAAAPGRPLAISAGVANGMLIQRTEPVYPAIAKAARVSGAVELQATISKNGTIKDVHVVNGPAMLRQAAVDAVRQWRYRPYKLNNEPTDVETTININFSLGH
jgi:TonB family protein